MLGRISLAQSPRERRGIFRGQRDGPSCAIRPSVMNYTMDIGIRPVDHGQLSSYSPEVFPSQASKSSREDRTGTLLVVAEQYYCANGVSLKVRKVKSAALHGEKLSQGKRNQE